MDLMNMIQGQMGEAVFSQIAEQVGIDKNTAKMASATLIPALINGMAKNAQNQNQAESLANALEKKHNGSIFDNPTQAVGNKSVLEDGSKIVGHILGQKRNGIEQVVGQSAGLQTEQVGQLMNQLAPFVIGALGKQKQQKGLDVGGLMGMLSGERESINKQMPEESSLLEKLLDQDGDGSIADDVTNIGMKVFGNLFKK